MTHAALAHAVSDREDTLGVIRLNRAVAAHSDQAYAVIFNREGFDASSTAQARARLVRKGSS